MTLPHNVGWYRKKYPKNRTKALIITDVVQSVSMERNSVLKNKDDAQNLCRISHQLLVLRTLLASGVNKAVLLSLHCQNPKSQSSAKADTL